MLTRTLYNIYSKSLMGLLATLAISCNDNLIEESTGKNPDGSEEFAQQPVLFSAGSERNVATRGQVSSMPDKVRFTAMMLTKTDEAAGYKYEKPVNAYMIVEPAKAGNSLYYKSDYSVPNSKDDYRNDNYATIFFWQNRLTHGFVGYIDDFNKALANAANPTNVYNPQELSGWLTNAPVPQGSTKYPMLYTKDSQGVIYRWQQFEKFDLRENTEITSMSQQPDPLLAYKEQKPVGSNPETNRVFLTFRHQFAQVEVNLRNSAMSANIAANDIISVELLGISQYAYVFPYPEYGYTTNNAGEQIWSIIRQGKDATKTELLRAAEGQKVDLSAYTEEQLKLNPHGTSFKMFEMDEPALNYLKSFECIAFGNLEALRIVWQEPHSNGTPGIQHKIIFPIPDEKFIQMESGKRYIYNLELQRGTLAVINAVIDDWIPYVFTDENGDKHEEYVIPGTVDKTATGN